MLMLVGCAVLGSFGCRENRKAPAPMAKTDIVTDLNSFEARAIGNPVEGKPWITHVQVADLDGDGRADLIACDAKKNAVTWLRQIAPNQFQEMAIGAEIAGPVHTEAVDIDGDHDIDVLVASMGQVFPNNDKIGSIVILENDGRQQFTKRIIAQDVSRVTDVRAADFNGDGRLDLAVAQFGYEQGEVCWMENLGNWQFQTHVLLNLSGAINVCIADFDNDGKQDIAALLSQQWEEIYLFTSDGAGKFSSKVIFGSTNEDFGSSGMTACDLNRDGLPDLLYTNGDGFDYAEPGSRPWHGVQWLENRGHGVFKNHRIGSLPGAYGPVALDVDADGAMDVIAVSGFNDWKNPRSASLVMFQNDGRMGFVPHVLANAPTHLITCVAFPSEGAARPAFVTGGFHAYPPWDRMSRLTLWTKKAVQ